MDAQELKALFGTEEDRKAIDWAGLKAQNKQLCAIHPMLDLTHSATIPDKETVIDLMRDVMDYWFDERIECSRTDGKKIAVLPIKGYWRIGRISGRGLVTEKPAECHDKMVEMVFWSKEAVESDDEMRAAVPPDLLENIEWWFVGIDPLAAGSQTEETNQ